MGEKGLGVTPLLMVSPPGHKPRLFLDFHPLSMIVQGWGVIGKRTKVHHITLIYIGNLESVSKCSKLCKWNKAEQMEQVFQLRQYPGSFLFVLFAATNRHAICHRYVIMDCGIKVVISYFAPFGEIHYH